MIEDFTIHVYMLKIKNITVKHVYTFQGNSSIAHANKRAIYHKIDMVFNIIESNFIY